MDKPKIAYLIGGFMDLSKITVDYEMDEIYFLEPLDVASFRLSDSASAYDMECKKVFYRLIGKTPSEALIYEFKEPPKQF